MAVKVGWTRVRLCDREKWKDLTGGRKMKAPGYGRGLTRELRPGLTWSLL